MDWLLQAEWLPCFVAGLITIALQTSLLRPQQQSNRVRAGWLQRFESARFLQLLADETWWPSQWVVDPCSGSFLFEISTYNQIFTDLPPQSRRVLAWHQRFIAKTVEVQSPLWHQRRGISPMCIHRVPALHWCWSPSVCWCRQFLLRFACLLRVPAGTLPFPRREWTTAMEADGVEPRSKSRAWSLE